MRARRNIEYKARLASLDVARGIAASVATERVGSEEQTDTYFVVPHGRLKLREIAGRGAWLIAYQREDRAATRGSDYHLAEITAPADCRAALLAALGRLVVVRKRREILLYHQVRIHLDEVADLGAFLEFEAVLGPDDADDTGHQLLAWLLERFRPALGEPIAMSYSDLMLALTSAQFGP